MIRLKEWAECRTTKPIPIKQILDISGITIRDFLGMKKYFKPAILKFAIKDLRKWKQLKYKLFEFDNDDWKCFVWYMRQQNEQLLQSEFNFDWVFGPVTDGGLFSVNYKDIKAYRNKNQLAILRMMLLNFRYIGGDSMLNTNKNSELRNEINLIINRIVHELINEFGKSREMKLWN